MRVCERGTSNGQSLNFFRQLNDFRVGGRIRGHCFLHAAQVLHLPTKTNDFSLGPCDLILQLSILPLQLSSGRFKPVPTEAAASAARRCWRLRVNTKAGIVCFGATIAATVVLLQLCFPRAQPLLRGRK